MQTQTMSSQQEREPAGPANMSMREWVQRWVGMNESWQEHDGGGRYSCKHKQGRAVSVNEGGWSMAVAATAMNTIEGRHIQMKGQRRASTNEWGQASTNEGRWLTAVATMAPAAAAALQWRWQLQPWTQLRVGKYEQRWAINSGSRKDNEGRRGCKGLVNAKQQTSECETAVGVTPNPTSSNLALKTMNTGLLTDPKHLWG